MRIWEKQRVAWGLSRRTSSRWLFLRGPDWVVQAIPQHAIKIKAMPVLSTRTLVTERQELGWHFLLRTTVLGLCSSRQRKPQVPQGPNFHLHDNMAPSATSRPSTQCHKKPRAVGHVWPVGYRGVGPYTGLPHPGPFTSTGFTRGAAFYQPPAKWRFLLFTSYQGSAFYQVPSIYQGSESLWAAG
jgi:hypothetical protein